MPVWKKEYFADGEVWVEGEWDANAPRAGGFLALRCCIALAQDPRTTFRANVHLVRVLATVKDASGALVGSLEKGDFEVRDNGVPQEISRCSSARRSSRFRLR